MRTAGKWISRVLIIALAALVVGLYGRLWIMGRNEKRFMEREIRRLSESGYPETETAEWAKK